MRGGFKVFLLFFAVAELAILVFQVDRWPVTSYPMYANTEHYRATVDHVGWEEGGRVRFARNPLNSMLNGPHEPGRISPRDRAFLNDLLEASCPKDRVCRLYRTSWAKAPDGRFHYESQSLNFDD